MKEYIERKRRLIDEALGSILPEEAAYGKRLIDAMRYSLLSGGKRLRPIIFLASVETVGGDSVPLLKAACAIELIHTYSLIHDDLPAMDNDDFRRGRPTCHKIFGEAGAILAGDALLTEAFKLLSSPELEKAADASKLLRVINIIASAAGVDGMVAGQMADIDHIPRSRDKEELEFIHRKKTGALIRASAETGALLGGGNKEEVEALARYGELVGLAFQIKDDLLNVEGDPVKLGKPVKSDEQKGKATYPGIHGLGEAQQRARLLADEAILCLKRFGSGADPLRYIANYIIDREK